MHTRLPQGSKAAHQECFCNLQKPAFGFQHQKRILPLGTNHQTEEELLPTASKAKTTGLGEGAEVRHWKPFGWLSSASSPC